MDEAVRVLSRGEPVAVPTETVYGLAADATNGDALARIFEAKGRPRFNPLIVHVASLAMAESIGSFDPLSRALAAKFWPGPLTLVVPVREGALHPLALAGLSTVGLRMPQGYMLELISALGRPLAAPSANPSGRLSPTTAEAAYEGLKGRIELVIDGGPVSVGVESTILKAEKGAIRLLRPGGLSAEEIEGATGFPIERAAPNGAIEAPGMMLSHYAPNAAMRLDASEKHAGETLLGFGGTPGAALDLSPTGDLREAARNLFSYLKRLDATGAATIAVASIPRTGLGEAINDRLVRAAAPRA
ncbi:MAG: threonylcarbamoyl-AMP synthase [Methylobacterium mesophilicum]|nr:threonylcarbamoyl-AMP synthase [Methylobacterium mesophilicum]